MADPVVSHPAMQILMGPVLFVEDEAMVREALSAMLVSQGPSVLTRAIRVALRPLPDRRPEQLRGAVLSNTQPM